MNELRSSNIKMHRKVMKSGSGSGDDDHEIRISWQPVDVYLYLALTELEEVSDFRSLRSSL